MSETAPQGQPRSSTGLQTNVGSGLAYLFGWITGLIFYLIEKEDREVRYHAAQSLIVSVALTAVFIVLSILGFLPGINLIAIPLQFLLGLGSFVLWIYMLIQGFQGRHFKLPYAGDMAERWAAQ